MFATVMGLKDADPCHVIGGEDVPAPVVDVELDGDEETPPFHGWPHCMQNNPCAPNVAGVSHWVQMMI